MCPCVCVCVCVFVCVRYFREPINILCEFIPMVLFLMCIFGYMIGLIFAKWILFSATDANCAPNILIGMSRLSLSAQCTLGLSLCA